MHGLADTTADVLAVLRHAIRWRMDVASAPDSRNAHRSRRVQPDIEKFDYG